MPSLAEEAGAAPAAFSSSKNDTAEGLLEEGATTPGEARLISQSVTIGPPLSFRPQRPRFPGQRNAQANIANTDS